MSNIYTIEQLRALQALPFERKILITQTRILEWYHRNGGKVYVSYSGGKDSSVLLALVRQQFPGVKACYVLTGLEYPEVTEFVRQTPNTDIIRPEKPFKQTILEKGYPVVSKDVAMTVKGYRRGKKWAVDRLDGLGKNGEPCAFMQNRYGRWRFLVDSDFPVSDDCCRIMKEAPLDKYQRKEGLVPFIGTLAEESDRREKGWLRSGCNAFDSSRPRSAPLSFWTEQDILRYIHRYKVPIPSVYGEVVRAEKVVAEGKDKGHFQMVYKTTGCQRTGCCFCLFGCHLEKEPNRIQRLAATHPKLYEYCLKDTDSGGLGLKRVMEYVGIPYKPATNKVIGENENE
jgi:3'-phosphoadenosine 5'-phosphosulfate sulfotransferase (PAPS reductase)/FAD synthetase